MTAIGGDFDVAGRVAFVSGASRGIGAGIAEHFAARGLRLVLCARSGAALPDSDDVLGRRVDVRDEAGMNSLVVEAEARFGAIDLWVNNAGVLDPIAPVRDVSTADFREHIDINLTGLFLGTRTFVRHLRARGGGGVLINVSSGAAWQAYEGWAAYCAGKAGVERLTEVVAAEEEASGLRAYSIAPGVVDTAMQELIRSCGPERFPAVDRFREMSANQSFNTAEFVARHFLAIAFDPEAQPDSVAVALPDEHA